MATKNTALHYSKGDAVRNAIDTYNEGGIDALLNWEDKYSDIGTGKKWLADAAGMGMAGSDNQWDNAEVEALLNKSLGVWGGAPKEAKFGRVTDKLKEAAPYLGMAAGMFAPGLLGSLGSVGKLLSNPLTGQVLNAAGAKTMGGALSGFGTGKMLGGALGLGTKPTVPTGKNVSPVGNIFAAIPGALSGSGKGGEVAESDALTGMNEMFQGTPMGLELLGIGGEGKKPGGKQVELNPTKWNWQDLLGLDGDAAMGPVKGPGAQLLGGLGALGVGGGLLDLFKNDKGLPPAAQAAPVGGGTGTGGGAGGGVGSAPPIKYPDPYQYQQQQMPTAPQYQTRNIQPFKTQAFRGY